jgi:hypothetical protein
MTGAALIYIQHRDSEGVQHYEIQRPVHRERWTGLAVMGSILIVGFGASLIALRRHTWARYLGVGVGVGGLATAIGVAKNQWPSVQTDLACPPNCPADWLNWGYDQMAAHINNDPVAASQLYGRIRADIFEAHMVGTWVPLLEDKYREWAEAAPDGAVKAAMNVRIAQGLGQF